MKGSFQGTWETSGGGSGGLAVVIVLVLLFGSGAAAALSAAVIGVLVAAAVLLVASAAGLGCLVYRSRRRQAEGMPSFGGIVRPPVVHQLAPEPERPAIAASHQHLHLHIGSDADPAQVAAVMRQVRGHLAGGQPDIAT